MTKAELIERIARSRDLPPDLTKKDIALILGVAFEELATYFARTKVTRASSPRFTFPHFGTFTKKRRSARRGVNPRTLEPMEIEAFDTVDFKASKELRESMNPGDAAASKTGRRGKTSAKSATKSATKTSKRGATKTSKACKSKRSSATVVASRVGIASGRRQLTPRDEDAELDAMIDDDELFPKTAKRGSANGKGGAELPAARMQRVESAETDEARPRPRRRARTLP